MENCSRKNKKIFLPYCQQQEQKLDWKYLLTPPTSTCLWEEWTVGAMGKLTPKVQMGRG